MAISNKKIWILMPDGVSVRNFVYSGFANRIDNNKVVFWTSLPFLAKEYDVCDLPPMKSSWHIDILKNAMTEVNIRRNAKKSGDTAFLSYLRKNNITTVKHFIKVIIQRMYVFYGIFMGIEKLRAIYENVLRRSNYYAACSEQLKREKPDIVFCTNQRMTNAAAPILAAKDLGIQTATFIYSWDNMPKGNLAVPAEHLLVWSGYMKREALAYYPFVSQRNVHVVGTPQFLPYTDNTLIEKRETFCKRYGLDPKATLICFSGDDITTSPYDPLYLRDTAEAVRRLNRKGEKRFQILFRRCPVDFSERYREVLEAYKNEIVDVPPLWEKSKDTNEWSHILPTQEDVRLLTNVVYHCATAVNVGSTIAHDFACMDKTSCYFRYNVKPSGKWDIYRVYNYIHFRSMGKLKPIYWIDGAESIERVLLDAIEDRQNKLSDAKQWLQTVVAHPLDEVNKRIRRTLEQLTAR